MVEFDKNWDPNRSGGSLQSRITNADMEKIKSNLASAFQEQFTNDLSKAAIRSSTGRQQCAASIGGYCKSLHHRPAKATSQPTKSYTTETGRMTLVAELRDSVTNQLLARAVDTEQGRESHNFMLDDLGSELRRRRDGAIGMGRRSGEGLDAARGGKTHAE